MVVLRYLAEAPLSTMTNNYKRALAASRAEAIQSVTPSLDFEALTQKHFAAATAAMRDTKTALEILSRQLEAATVRIGSVEAHQTPPYVRNNTTKKIHRAGDISAADPRHWRTVCRIHFVVRGNYARLDSIPEDALPENHCSKCFG